MKLQIKVFLALLLTLIIIFGFFIYFIKEDFGIRYVESVEDSLNDTAQILASIIEKELTNNKIDSLTLKNIFDNAFNKRFLVKIYKTTKSKIDLNMYVVDGQGIVIYDSFGKLTGKNFSRWNDVYLTLRGEYGARITMERNNNTGAIYVAAPIKYNDKIIGAVTVIKSNYILNRLKKTAQERIIFAIVVAFILSIVLILAISYWITDPIIKLTKYVRSLKKSKIHKQPKLGNTEIKELGLAFEDIFAELEGKKYIESYIQSLTHEIKSPLSSIRAAAELLEEKIPEKDKIKFYNNIKTESIRIEEIISKLLELAEIENRKELKNITLINTKNLINEIKKSLSMQIERKKLTIITHIDKKHNIKGEKFLIMHSIKNVMENAIKFSFEGKAIEISAGEEENKLYVSIKDEGCGIPDFAYNKIFDKFYSLPPKGTTKKGTGLGLPFAKEVALLHNGNLTVKNNNDSGVTSTIYFSNELN